jgi:hypothetical protein
MPNDVKYSCGHTAPRTKAFQPWHKCPACHLASDGAAKRNEEAGLPPLEGTDKQKRWAEGIRDKAFRALEKLMESWAKIDVDGVESITQRQGKLIRLIIEQKDSAWWIAEEDRDWVKTTFDGILKPLERIDLPASRSNPERTSRTSTFKRKRSR